MPRLLTIAVFVALSGVAACATFPDLDTVVSDRARNSDYPELLPMNVLLARVGEGRLDERYSEQFSGRVAGLRARAARLRGPVLSTRKRAELTSALRRLQ